MTEIVPRRGRTRRLIHLALLGTVTSVTAGWASPVSAQTKQECVDAHEKSQSSRDEGRLLDARVHALVCTREDCPKQLRDECDEFLVRLERDIPTVTFRARDEGGNDITDVRVQVDGQLLTERLWGTSVSLDPGQRKFRFTAAGYPPHERVVLVVAGQHNQLVDVVLATGRRVVPPPPPPQPTPPEGTDPKLVAGIVLGSIGVVGLLAFVGLGARGLVERADLDQCKPNCTDADVAPSKNKLIAADVSLAIGLTTGAVGVLLIGLSLGEDRSVPATTGTVRPRVPGAGVPQDPGGGMSRMMRLEIGPTSGGVRMLVRGSF